MVKKKLFSSNLATYVVNYFETFFTHYFNSTKQDAMVESQKINQFMGFALEVTILECFFSKP
jgi:hypothetical protein